LLYNCLSRGARDLCHLFRAARFSLSFCLTSSGQSCWECRSLGGGVACQAACCIAVVNLQTASSSSAAVFSGIFKLICVSISSLNTSQSVFLL
jgi:RNase P/RNase MRP subunit p30